MSEAKDAAKPEEKVLVFHSGQDHGPLQTACGVLYPGQSLLLPKFLADKLVGAYRHLKYASDIVPGGAKAAELAGAEKVKLQAQIKELEGKLANSGIAEKDAKIAELSASLGEFLQAKDKKDLAALQEKHAVPA